MRNIQHIEVIGNLISNPEIRTSKEGNEYVKVSIAVNLSSEKVQYHSLFAFGNIVSVLSSFQKGELVLVNGDIEFSLYTTKAGDTKVNSNITVKRILKISLPKIIKD